MTTEFVFLAVQPAPEEARVLHELGVRLGAALGLSGVPIPPERLHVTLLPMADDHSPGGLAPYLDRALQRLPRLQARPFDIGFDRVESLGGGGPGVAAPVALRVRWGRAGARTLQAGLSRRLGDAVAPEWERNGLRPHMTLAWDRLRVAARPLERSAGFRATEVVLIRSFRGEGRYETLARLPFP